ncbi:MAG: dTMP kinase, partial [Bacteroidota bacterium]
RSTDSKSAPDRMEQSGEEFFKKTREGYLRIAESSVRKIFIIKANDDVEDIREQVKNIIDSFITNT